MSRIHHHPPQFPSLAKPTTSAPTANNAQVTQLLQQAAQALSQAASTFASAGPGNASSTIAPPPFSDSWCQHLPPPSPQQSSPPAGVGLTKGGDFGDNAVKTAGGYTIVPNGNTSWDIFAPGAKPGDKPMTNVSGDPHVLESDGTRWDFTKNSNFKLPDGTNISVSTSAQTGYAVTKGLDITNGADHVQISGVDGKASTGDVTHDGFKARADLASEDTYLLGGDAKDVKWFKQDADGKMEGEVVGASMTTKDGVQQYVQNTKADSQYVVDPSLQPPVGSEAWGNMLRDQAVDAARNTFGSGSAVAETVAKGADKDNTQVMAQEAQQQTQQAQTQQLLQAIEQLVKLLGMMNLGGSNGGNNTPISYVPKMTVN
jgi:Domain of Unknown Function (DUF1521)